MRYSDDFEYKKIVNSRPPLRWIANISGSLATYCINRAFDAKDKGKLDLSDFYGNLGSKLIEPYIKWGTMYKVKLKDEDWD